MSTKFIDLTGQKFGRLTVVERGENSSTNMTRWICVCECGNKSLVQPYSLKSGRTQSCGCLHNEITSKIHVSHRMSNAPIYHVWEGMKGRCNNPKFTGYEHWGGRGITVCPEWNDFEAFYSWAVPSGYAKGLTIDRINNDGNYEPSNCQWITQKAQNRKYGLNVIITYNGKSQIIDQWAKELGMKYMTLWSRLFTYKWSIHKAFTTPVRIVNTK